MIRNGQLVINLHVVGVILAITAVVGLLAGLIACTDGFFSYSPEVTSVEPVPSVPGAYFVLTTEVPAEGATWFNYEPRNGSYIVLPDSSVLTYPEMKTPWDPAKTEILTERILHSMKHKLVENVISNQESELITVTPDND